MTRLTCIPMICCLAAIASVSYAEETESVSSKNPAWLNGVAIGRALADSVSDAEREAFLRGIIAGMQDPYLPVTIDDALRDNRRRWFADPDIGAKQRASYAQGVILAENNRSDDSLYSVSDLVAGMLESMQSDGTPYVSTDEATLMLTKHQRAKFFREKRNVGAMILTNERDGKLFLRANAVKDNVRETDSGLQYRIIEPGHGAHPTSDDVVSVSSTIATIDGNVVYDSAENENDGRLHVRVDGVIAGWQEALPMMQVGAEWEIFLPSNLAYGNAGWQDKIEPGEAVIFRLKLHDIVAE